MSSKPTEPPKALRPTKKQRELLTFIERFIAEYGYSPSYREIMAGLHYTSVATVALHINSLIHRGHLRKRDYSARSIELTNPADEAKITTNIIAPAEEKWLIEKIDHAFKQVEQGELRSEQGLDGLLILLGALRVLGLEAAAQSFTSRFNMLKKKYGQSS